MIKTIHPAMAVYPNASPWRAMELLRSSPNDGPFALDLSQCQITPQNFRRWTATDVAELAGNYPDTGFRFHASVRLKAYRAPRSSHQWFDIGRFVEAREQGRTYFRELGKCNQALGSPVYTLHSGRRPKCGAKMEQIRTAVDAISQIMQCRVGVETLYPGKQDGFWWLDSWPEHEELLEAQIPFVLDFSHVNIIAARHGRNDTLVRELLASPNLLEIHISGNDGGRDSHESLTTTDNEWWWPMLSDYSGPATVFTEGRIQAPRRINDER